MPLPDQRLIEGKTTRLPSQISLSLSSIMVSVIIGLVMHGSLLFHDDTIDCNMLLGRALLTRRDTSSVTGYGVPLNSCALHQWHQWQGLCSVITRQVDRTGWPADRIAAVVVVETTPCHFLPPCFFVHLVCITLHTSPRYTLSEANLLHYAPCPLKSESNA